eukprot:m.120086 g.120086  ORF g.120086 m.120086 type:complete len:544 (-) comp28786_c0_seq1:427-2058(-)
MAVSTHPSMDLNSSFGASELPSAFAALGKQVSRSSDGSGAAEVLPTTRIATSSASRKTSLTWPSGLKVNMGRRHSIQHIGDRLLPTSPLVHAGTFAIDATNRIGSTALTNAWDTSTQPHTPLCCQVVTPNVYKAYLQREGRVWMTLRKNPHPNLPLLVACQDPGKSSNTDDGFIFFNAVYGDLYGDARSTRPHIEVLKTFRQMVRAVAHCHKHRIVLGNVKLGKFLWANREHTTIQLADLGGSQLVREGDRCKVSNAAGSPAYIAPEVLSEVEDYDGFAADVWSLGVVCYVLLTGRYPFEDKTSVGLFKKIKSADIVYPENLPDPIVNFLKELLVRDPTERPLASTLATHKLLAAPSPSTTPQSPPPPQQQRQLHLNTADTDEDDDEDDTDDDADDEANASRVFRPSFSSLSSLPPMTEERNSTCSNSHRRIQSRRQSDDAVVPLAIPTVPAKLRRHSLQTYRRPLSQDSAMALAHAPEGVFRSGKRGSGCAGLDLLPGEREVKRSHSTDTLASMEQQFLLQQSQLHLQHLRQLHEQHLQLRR